MKKIKTFLNKLVGLLKQGLAPKELALSTLLTLILTVIPVFGVTTILISFTALKLRLNLALMVALSYVIYPLQFILFIPYIKSGEWIFAKTESGLTLDKMIIAFKTDFFLAIKELGIAVLGAILSWGISSILIGIPLYYLLLWLFNFTQKSRA